MTFGAEIFWPNQRSKPTFRKNAEHYVAYNAVYVIYYDTISCMYQHIQAKMLQSCVISEQTAIIWPQKNQYFDFDWLTLGRPDQVKSSMFAFFVSANAAKLFIKLFTLFTNLFLWCGLK